MTFVNDALSRVREEYVHSPPNPSAFCFAVVAVNAVVDDVEDGDDRIDDLPT